MKHFQYFCSRVLLNFPGFKSFDVRDQMILLRLAQSQSRILAAALAWFNSDSQTFTDFLPWRELKPGQVDLFQELLTDYAKNVQNRNLDPVESALFNIVVVIATGEQVPSSQQRIAVRKCVVLGLHSLKLALCSLLESRDRPNFGFSFGAESCHMIILGGVQFPPKVI